MDATLVRALTETSQSQTTDKWHLADILKASLDLERLLIDAVLSLSRLHLWSVVKLPSVEEAEAQPMLVWRTSFHGRIDSGLLAPLDLNEILLEPDGELIEAWRGTLFSHQSRQLIKLLNSQHYRFELDTGPKDIRNFYLNFS